MVRMLVGIAGHADPENGHPADFSYAPGDIVELSDHVKEAWLAAGHCELIEEPKVSKGSKGR